MKTSIIIGGIALAGVAAFFLMQPSVAEKRAYLSTLDNGVNRDKFQRMTDQEINDSYEAVTKYFLKGVRPSVGSPLQTRLAVISQKYNIFT